MTLTWDYSAVAACYDARPAYAPAALDRFFDRARLPCGVHACDAGAGTGMLTRGLLERGCRVVAVEPNAAMRARGRASIGEHPALTWVAGRAEALPTRSRCFHVIAFGSSFNVVHRPQALRESARVLVPGGWFLCLWNHRRLDDPLQARIEGVIRAHVPHYRHGSRREDQTLVIATSGLFEEILAIESPVVHTIAAARYVDAWKSHLTLRRQAGARFAAVMRAIEAEVASLGLAELTVPFMTRAWMAQRPGSSS